MEYKKGDYLVIDPDMVMSDNQDDYEKSDYLDGDTNTSDYNSISKYGTHFKTQNNSPIG